MENMALSKFYQGKKVLITGHTGFKGTWLVSMMCQLGAEVCGYSLQPGTQPNMYDLMQFEQQPNIKYQHHLGDIRDYDHLFQVMQSFQPEIVFHLSAQPIVLRSYQKPRDTFDINVMGTVNLLECMRQIGSVKSFVNVTTDKVYLNNDLGRPFVEDDALCGYDPYSNSKSCSELVTYCYRNSFFNPATYAEHGLAISTCRAGNVIGGGDWQEYRIVPDLIRSINTHKPVIIRNPKAVRPFQFVLEALYIYALVAMRQFEDHQLSGAYNIGPSLENCICVEQMLAYFMKYEPQIKYQLQPDPNAKHEAAILTLDTTKLQQTFGYQPVYTLEESVKLICEWNQAYRNGADMYAVTQQQIAQFLSKISH